jgi:hypothetical protein
MANNFINAIKTNISAESSAPTEIYAHATKKAIIIELDASNKSSAGITIGVGVEDTTANGSAFTGITVATNGTFTKSGSAHGFSVNDRVIFVAGTPPTIALGSSDTTLSVTRRYFVQAVTAGTGGTFHIAETRSATTAITFTNTGSITNVKLLQFAELVRDAPIPVGGALKVIAGQKMVLEATDKLFTWCSSASTVDIVTSILEDVS